MKYATAAWKAERLSWRSVIQLNVIRSIISVVETIELEMIGTRSSITLSKIKDDTEKEELDEGPPIQFSNKPSSFVLGLSVMLKKTSGVVSVPARRSSRPPTLPCGRHPLIRTSCLTSIHSQSPQDWRVCRPMLAGCAQDTTARCCELKQDARKGTCGCRRCYSRVTA